MILETATGINAIDKLTFEQLLAVIETFGRLVMYASIIGALKIWIRNNRSK